MWIMMNDCFLSIVHKDCPEGSLLVRARRPGDIEKVFGRRTKVTRATDADYLYRAVVTRDEVNHAMENEIARITYGNFKSSVQDNDLHDSYMRVWTAMAAVQDPRPYSTPFVGDKPYIVGDVLGSGIRHKGITIKPTKKKRVRKQKAVQP